MEVGYFATFRNLTDKDSEIYNFLEDATILESIREGISRHPVLSEDRIAAAIDTILDHLATLQEGDFAAIFPAVSGG